jgi:hypothetical protein
VTITRAELDGLKAAIVSEHEDIAVMVDHCADAIAAGLPPYQIIIALRELARAIRTVKKT